MAQGTDPIDSTGLDRTVQKRFWNWQDEDSTFELSQWRLGIIDAGLYRGFDRPAVFPPTMRLTLNHSTTGARRTNIDRTLSSLFGVLVTKQGVVVRQDGAISVTIDPSTTARTDLIIFEHEYKEIAGGIDGVYKVIKGTGANVPTLDNPNIQIILGYLYLPANTTKLNAAGVTYTKANIPTLGNNMDFILKSNGFFLTSLDGRGNRIINLGNPINNQDAATKIYVDEAIANNIRIATEEVRGIIEIADESESLSGVDNSKAVTPYKAKIIIEDRIATQPEANGNDVSTKFITPKSLGNRIATTDRRGIIKIATDEEAADPSNNQVALTPYHLNKSGNVSAKVVEIGNWNMASTQQKVINHNYDWWEKIVGIDLVIISDSGNRSTMYNTSEDVTVNNNTIFINGDTAHYAGSNFDSAAINRGYILFWVKNDIVQPPSSIAVNAGIDQSGSYRLLQWGTPVLNSVRVSAQSTPYRSGLPKLKAIYTAGVANNLGTFQMYAKRKNASGGSIWNNWNAFGGSEMEGYITDTGNAAYMDGLYYIKIICNLFGMQLESNVVEINLYDNGGSITGTTWNASGNPVSNLNRVLWNLSGSIESIGSPLSSSLWTVASKPEGANTVFGNANAQTTNFFGDKFGTYELKLSGANAAGNTADDTMIIQINEITNYPPTAVAKWSASNADPIQNVTWQVYNPTNGTWYGYYSVSLFAGSSSDPDGYIVGYHWQFNYENAGWQDLTTDAPNFPSTPTASKEIRGDGAWKFRVRCKDNVGAISNWSNEITLNITGSNTTVTPLNTFALTYLSGGTGYSHSYAQLSIAPIENCAKLTLTVNSYTHGNPTAQQTNDFYVKIQGSSVLQYYFSTTDVGVVKDVSSIRQSSMLVWIDLNNVPPYKQVQLSLKAYDASNNLIGEQLVNMGAMPTTSWYRSVDPPAPNEGEQSEEMIRGVVKYWTNAERTTQGTITLSPSRYHFGQLFHGTCQSITHFGIISTTQAEPCVP